VICLKRYIKKVILLRLVWQLISDRFGSIDDPTVRRFAPKLIASLDRAIRLCTDTLRYGQAEETAPKRTYFELKPLVQEVGESLDLPRPGRISWKVEVDDSLKVSADRDQLYRVLTNLCRNAYQVLDTEFRESGENEVKVKASRTGSVVSIEVSDSGPGLPERARKHLFEAFKGVARKGGTGLGLAISSELIKVHGGQIELLATVTGTTFQLTIPDPPVDLQEARRKRSA
jgi:signal transduction histidine kinase